MTLSMTELMRTVRNFFPTGWVHGIWTVEQGVLSGPAALEEGQWIAIDDCTERQGVFQLGPLGALPQADGSWTGRVWLLSPPGDFLRLLEDVNTWMAQQNSSALRHERFGQYSRTWAEGASPLSWEQAFSSRLRPWRRMFSEVKL